jgi:acyl-CoA thioesterase-1
MPRAARTLLLAIALSLPSVAFAAEKTILVFGDSLAAAYGIAQARGWVNLLAERLKRERPDYIVVNASISGETTGGGAARFDAALQKHRPQIVVLELGGNDGLRGLPVLQMKKNLSSMIERAQKSGARVLLVGMQIPPNYGIDYAQSFQDAYVELAKRHKTALLPFLLEGFADKQELFQSDRIHPTQEAQPLIEQRVWSALKPLLK